MAIPVIVIPVAEALENAVAPDPVMLYVPDPVMDLVAVPVLVKVPLFKVSNEISNVPCVNVSAVTLNASYNVVVPVLLIIRDGKVVLPLLVMVPVPTIVGVKAVNVPPLDNVNPFNFNAVVPMVNAVLPKLNVLNELPVVNVAIELFACEIKVKFGELVDVPLEETLPNVNVRVKDIVEIKPPVPEQEKLLATGINNTFAPAVVVDSIILLLPNSIARVVELLLLNVPVVKVYELRFIVPLVSVVIALAATLTLLNSVVTFDEPLLIVKRAIFFSLVLIVPAPLVVTLKPVNVAALDNSKEFTFSAVVA
jgi:hypothetical protein